jgi:hypothetical protein
MRMMAWLRNLAAAFRTALEFLGRPLIIDDIWFEPDRDKQPLLHLVSDPQQET